LLLALANILSLQETDLELTKKKTPTLHSNSSPSPSNTHTKVESQPASPFRFYTYRLFSTFDNFYSPPIIIKIIKSRRMRLAGHVARIGRRGMHIGLWWESQKGGDHWEDLDVGGRIILEQILDR
jgi:hypothetical protein